MPTKKETALRQCAAYIRWAIQVDGQSRRTLAAYRNHWDTFWDDHPEDRGWPDITLAHLEAYASRPTLYGRRGSGVAPTDATRKTRMMAFKGLYKWLVREKYVHTNVAAELKVPKFDAERPNPMAREQIGALWSGLCGARAAASSADERLQADADLVGLGLGLWCGLRGEEIQRLRPGHVVKIDGQWLLANFKRKGGVARWPVPFVSLAALFEEHMPAEIGSAASFLDAMGRLASRQKERDDYLLGPWREAMKATGRKPKFERPADMLPPKLIWRRMKGACERAGLDYGGLHPHMMRHSFGTYACNVLEIPLIDVSHFMGHTSMDITKMYVRRPDDPIADRLEVAPEFEFSSFSPYS